MKPDKTLTPPLADQKPYQHNIHDDIRMDPFFWLKERENPEVIDYLERENDYYQKSTKHLVPLQNDLFEEMKGRIKEEDNSVPYFYNGYWYITRFEKGQDYPIYTRKKDRLDAAEEILFDCNEMAKGHDYFRLVGINISPDNTKAIVGIDTVSRRQYVLKVKDLISGEIFDTSIENTTGSSVWANDNTHFFFTKKNPTTLRSEAIYRHSMNDLLAESEVVFEEKDETYSTFVSGSKSEEYIFIGSYSTLTSEYHYLDANKPLEKFTVIQKRTPNLEYSISHYGDHFYIFTNADKAENYKLMKTPVVATSKDNWIEVLPHRPSVLLEDMELFNDYWVITERENGLAKVRIQRWDGTEDYYLPLEGETYTVYTSTNIAFNTTKLRYVYNSMTTPSSVIEYDMATKEQFVLKEQEVLGGKFDKLNYISKRLWAPAADGTMIPISLVYHKDTPLSQRTPILQYAYGSYGSTIDPGFSSTRLSLLDRGFAFAIAHVRGGEYLGRKWYDSGKMLQKKNTFTDFIDCSKHLIGEGLTSANHLYSYGGSAGGLLMGVIVNDAPELYNGVIAAVPFVDVVTTMLDDTIPLTTSEYDEWGNPNDKPYYDYMKSYSPYDNIKEQAYPNLLVTTGLHDSQVQYWEPAKWVARLRLNKKDETVLFLDTNMSAGHGGASGRFDALKETAKKYAFLLALENSKN
ncbi:S9 family peptidase [Flavobacteriaceae bacterium]|nr:S9 family peptidase [Flavobacteriaceae bacterium]MDC1402671.1 S9 family peptidase [Flavobacteriaceae bacterium]